MNLQSDSIALRSVGKPSIAYGIARRLAYEQRRGEQEQYLRVQYGWAGSRGIPRGGMQLEVNGGIYRFGAGLKEQRPDLLDPQGNLSEAGEKTLACGIPGFLTTSCDWRWIQREVDLTSLLTDEAIGQVTGYFEALVSGAISLPIFQARRWLEKWGEQPKPNHYNCTTIILEQLRKTAGLTIDANVPLAAIEALAALVYYRSPLDNQLNYTLSVPEEEILLFLQKDVNAIDWNSVAKSVMPLPKELTWDFLFSHFR